MTVKVQFLSETARREIEEANEAIVDLLSSANRKHRVLGAEVRERAKRRDHVLVVALLSSVAALATMSAQLTESRPNLLCSVPATIAALTGVIAIVTVLVKDRSAKSRALHTDTKRFAAIIKVIKFMRGGELHTTPIGRDVLLYMSKDLKTIAEDHKDIDPVEIELLGARPGTPRLKEKRSDRIRPRHNVTDLTLGGGEKRMATIKDVPRSGVALQTDAVIDPASMVTIGSTPARNIRAAGTEPPFDVVKPKPNGELSDFGS